MSGIIEIVIDTPCFTCHRLARYTVYNRADNDLLERLRKPVTHRDVHDICAMLEEQNEQTPVGVCECGAVGQETTSVEFHDIATREDLSYVAPDLSFELVRLSLGGEILWESDLEIWRKGLGDILETPDPTPDEFITKSEQRLAEMDAIQARLHAAFIAVSHDPPGAGYIRAKARLYCQLGAAAYRDADVFRQPYKRLSAENLAAIDAAMHQFRDGRGFSAGKPLEIPAEFSHSALRAIHFDVTSQMARRSEDGRHLIDAQVGRHVLDRREVVIFNRVRRGGRS